MDQLGADLVSRLDLLGSIEAEIAGPPDMLPSRVMESVAAAHTTELAERDCAASSEPKYPLQKGS